RMTSSRIYLRRHPELVERCLDPLSSAFGVSVVFRLRAHARDAEEVEQLLLDARLVAGQKLPEIRRNLSLTVAPRLAAVALPASRFPLPAFFVFVIFSISLSFSSS